MGGFHAARYAAAAIELQIAKMLSIQSKFLSGVYAFGNIVRWACPNPFRAASKWH